MTITITGRITQTGRSITSPNPIVPIPGQTAAMAGGNDRLGIDWYNISNQGNAMTFGEVRWTRENSGGTSNGINDRGVWNGDMFFIEHVTLTTLGNATLFGNSVRIRMNAAATSNGSNDKAITVGGKAGPNNSTGHAMSREIEKINLSTPGNATLGGDIANIRGSSRGRQGCAATSNGINNRAVIAGGRDGSVGADNMMQYITISSGSNANFFGNLNTAEQSIGTGTSNGINDRAVFINGRLGGDSYVTISTLGDSVGFGAIWGGWYVASASNATDERGTSQLGTTIHYFTINTLGDSTSFGTLDSGISKHGSMSNSLG